MDYEIDKILLSPLLSQAIISSSDISKSIANFIKRYRQLDFGDISEVAYKLNLINAINKNLTVGVYPLINDFIVIFTITSNKKRITSCLFLQEFLDK